MSDFDAITHRDAPATPPPAGYGAPGLPAAPIRRRRRWPIVLVVVCALVLGTAWVLSRINVNDYVITPGDAVPVTPLIDVPPSLDHPLTGNILLTDVYVSPLTALSYLQYRFLDSDSEVLSTSALRGPSTPESQYIDQGYLDMSQAQSDATAAALSHLGYSFNVHNAGTLVYGVQPGSPASKSLRVAQVITRVNGTATPTGCALVTALHGLTPGTTVTLQVEQSSINLVGNFVPGPTATRTVTLGKAPKGLVDTGCGAPTTLTAFLGISTEDQLAWKFPVKVTVHTANIGGPSAGLSMTLGIIDKLAGGDLTGKRIVAATGTIDAQGDVGDVGGVAEKTIAVERAGATVFFVPVQELGAARSKASPQLHVYAVSTLDQALKILKHLGGKVPASHRPAQAAP